MDSADVMTTQRISQNQDMDTLKQSPTTTDSSPHVLMEKSLGFLLQISLKSLCML
jgi:hypothetical protein